MGEACHTGKRSLCEASQCQDVHKGRWQRSQNGDLLCRSINARMQSHYSSLLESKLGSLMHLVKCLCLPPSLDSPASRGAHYNSFVTKANKAVPEPTESEAGSLDLQGAAVQYRSARLSCWLPPPCSFFAIYLDRLGNEHWVVASMRSVEQHEAEHGSAVTLHFTGLYMQSTPDGASTPTRS